MSASRPAGGAAAAPDVGVETPKPVEETGDVESQTQRWVLEKKEVKILAFNESLKK